MICEFGCGRGIQKVNIAKARLICELKPRTTRPAEDETAEVVRALNAPIGSPLLKNIVKPGERVCVVTSDITRPMPTYKVMLPLLDELNRAGVPDRDIVVVSALGSHRAQTEAERRKLVGDTCFERVRVVDSDPNDVIRLGVTRRGTPVDITRVVAEADRRICLGNVEFHYFAGFSGGVKALMPGCSTPAAIQCNHSLMLSDRAFAGNVDDNPLRDDIEEAGRIAGADFLLNVVLDEHKNIVRAFAGDPVTAHRTACVFLCGIYGIRIPRRADIVICSQGGAPKDLNLYQTQKALDNARHAVKDGGIIILIGECDEGLGGSVFEDWMRSAKRPEELTDRIREKFVLGGHKAAAIAMVLRKAEIYLVSAMAPDLVRSIFMTPFDSAAAAYRAALRKLGPDATVITMPYGGSTLPLTD